MPHLLFKLNGVPEDEELEVRQLLDEHHIDYYDTTAGMFGFSLAALWLRDDVDLERAKALIDEYQQQRYEKARHEYEQRERDGTAERWWQRALRQPIKTLFILIVISVILYFTLVPFYMLMVK